ncbi:hypothetical protein PRK78_000174 [Emydomyces testavorans]|uniref:DUF7029 domain-containing protein n=1 Tax=Emydomyces testavorans TaxID=2070801 RepID=A0AAF0IHF5_9EURO|nr:hypothetical protein PRK78_000174 [Emydomyces testavorans]
MPMSTFMKSILFSVFVSLALLHVGAVAVSTKLAGDGLGALAFPAARKLYPATKPIALNQRSPISELLKTEAIFEYVEESGTMGAHSDTTLFTTTLLVKGREPILPLEDLEPDIRRVQCSSSKIELGFVSIDRLDEVGKLLAAAGTFIVVTSHSDCNNKDERVPHTLVSVTNIEVERDEKLIVLWKTKAEWKQVFASTRVHFARKPSNQIARRLHQKSNLRPGQDRKSSSLPPSPTLAIDLPFPSAPSSTDVPASSSDEVNMSLEDKVILPPATPVTGLIVPKGIKMLCKRCTLQGNAKLSQGSFQLENINDAGDLFNSTIAFFEHGSVELDVDGLFSHIELALNIDLGLQLLNFSIPLPVIPLSPFSIPGLVTFGVFVRPQISASIEVKKEIEFSYGFNASVPRNSKFIINIGDLGNSNVTGFPEILLGVHSIVGSTNGGIGMFFNLPQVSVNASTINDVDGNCNPKNVTKKEKREDKKPKGNDLAKIAEGLVGKFTNIIPKVEFNLGPLAELEVGVGSFDAAYATRIAIASKAFPLPTGCVAFNEKTKSYGDPADVVMEMNHKKNAAGRLSANSPNAASCLPGLLAFIVLMFGV